MFYECKTLVRRPFVDPNKIMIVFFSNISLELGERGPVIVGWCPVVQVLFIHIFKKSRRVAGFKCIF